MGIVSKYIDSSVAILMKSNPNCKKEDVVRLVESKVKEKISNPTVFMENDVKRKYETISLTKLCDWIDSTMPIVSGNATFYVQPEELQSPTVTMLRELKALRSTIKKEMFKALGGGNIDKYRRLDLLQYNTKRNMNAEYGASYNNSTMIS